MGPRARRALATASLFTLACGGNARGEQEPGARASPVAGEPGAEEPGAEARGRSVGVPRVPTSVTSPRPSLAPKDTSTWSCLCLQRNTATGPEPSTACFKSAAWCTYEQARAHFGTALLVAGPVPPGRGCRVVGEAAHPGELLGSRDSWSDYDSTHGAARPGPCTLGDQPESTRVALPEDPLRGELLGPLKRGMTAAAVVELLGEPADKGELRPWSANQLFVQEWSYPDRGLELVMLSVAETVPLVLWMLTAETPCDLKTTRGVGVGTSLKDARRGYADLMNEDAEEVIKKGAFVLGSHVHGALFFTIKDGEVLGRLNTDASP